MEKRVATAKKQQEKAAAKLSTEIKNVREKKKEAAKARDKVRQQDWRSALLRANGAGYAVCNAYGEWSILYKLRPGMCKVPST